jgi:hypothetical protein
MMVWGPQLGEALGHCMEGVLHCARSDRPLAGGEPAIAIALGKDLEEEDGVVDVGEGIIGAKGLAESSPEGPDIILCGGMQRNDSGIKCCQQQTEIRADFVTELRWHKCQGSFCGEVSLK